MCQPLHLVFYMLITSFNSPNNTCRYFYVLCFINEETGWDSESLSNLLKFTQLGSGRVRIQIHEHLAPNAMLRLPRWLRGKESACQCRRHGFNFWSGRISHAEKQLSACATIIKPVP